MNGVIEKMAIDNGLSAEQANAAYKAIVNHLLNNIPELESVVDSIFTETEAAELHKEINKLINLLQFRGMSHVKKFPMPVQTHRFGLLNELF